MSEQLLINDVGTSAPAKAPVVWRPVVFLLLVAATMAAFLWLAVAALSSGGFGPIDFLLVLLFAITLPWFVIGFWNATVGLLVMRFTSDPVATVTPAVSRLRGDEPITASTAILLCIRNEAPERVARLIEPMLDGLAISGVGEHFHLYVLSDTDAADIAIAEEARFSALASAWRGRIALTYRRRTNNVGYKAGNIRDFCECWGSGHEFAVMLDADSAMSVALLLKLVRLMQLDPRIGILQSLVIGMPSASPFARIFQFGMRLGMRSYTIGSAWWQGDCGPYWGHNAIVRLAPFTACCKLPVPTEGTLVKGHVLSHDQIEAVLMRKAGYEVRVLPQEGESFEQNPPTLVEFIRRDLRWCQGNMQYWRFLRADGVHPVSRYQLLLAILMFLGSPAWMALLLIGSAAVAMAPTPADFMRADAGIAVLVLVLLMWFAPNIATVIHVLTRPQERRMFGGGTRFVASFAITVIFVLLLAPITWASHTLFLARLLSGRTIKWGEQTRDDHPVPWRLAAGELWPQTLFGLVPICLLALTAPSAIAYALLIAAGPLLAIPFAVATASPAFGRALIAAGLDRLPEETQPPRELLALNLPALSAPSAVSRNDRALRPATATEANSGAVTNNKLELWRTARGVLRSMRIYYGDREGRAAMDRLYARFIQPGDLVFDVGAHVGDRIASFRRLGARVVAVEPQPALVRTLKLLYGRDRAVAIEPIAVGRSAGMFKLRLNLDNPTLSTASDELVRAAGSAPGWERESWTRTICVPALTLDALIERHGRPAFIKIDVEGLEAEVLSGLTHAVPALSFEFTTIQPHVAVNALTRCAELGYGRYNAAFGESQVLVHREWQSAGEIKAWLSTLPLETNSGDIYAVGS